MGNMINKEVEPFRVSAFVNGEFAEVSQEDLKGHWSVLFLYTADNTNVCPTKHGALAEHY